MSEALLIDSDILIDHLRKEQNALDYIQQEIDDGSPLFISVISRIEILSGARKGEEETIRSLFDILTSVDVDLGGKLGTFVQSVLDMNQLLQAAAFTHKHISWGESWGRPLHL